MQVTEELMVSRLPDYPLLTKVHPQLEKFLERRLFGKLLSGQQELKKHLDEWPTSEEAKGLEIICPIDVVNGHLQYRDLTVAQYTNVILP